MNQKLEEELLITLSYFEPMSFEFIYLDINTDFARSNPDLTHAQVMESLKLLENKKLIRKTVQNKQVFWIRLYPKRSVWQRIKSLFSF